MLTIITRDWFHVRQPDLWIESWISVLSFANRETLVLKPRTRRSCELKIRGPSIESCDLRGVSCDLIKESTILMPNSNPNISPGVSINDSPRCLPEFLNNYAIVRDRFFYLSIPISPPAGYNISKADAIYFGVKSNSVFVRPSERGNKNPPRIKCSARGVGRC